MTGSLQLKNGTYYVVVNLTVGGKRKQKWVNTHLKENCGKRELERKRREILSEYENAPKVEKSNVLFADYIMIWLAESKIKVEQVTYKQYQTETENHIYPYFKNIGVNLIDVDRQTLQNYFTEKHEHGRFDGKGGLSAKTLKHHKNIIHQALELAVVNKLIPTNPCKNLTLPKLERNNYDFYNLEETKAFLSAVKDEPLFPLYYVTAIYGLRRSEVLGLKWDSIDLNNKKLIINHTRVKCNDEIIEKDKTKTKASLRSFPLSDNMVDFFVRLKNEEKANKKLFGKSYVKNDYIFKWQDGRPYDPNYITSRFAKDLKKHGLKHIAFHGLRHSCGSLLNEQGFTLKDIQEWLGHSDIQTTANIYLHLDTKRKEKISDTMSNVLKI